MVGGDGAALGHAVAHKGQLAHSTHSQTRDRVTQNDADTRCHDQAAVGVKAQQHTGQAKAGPQGDQHCLQHRDFHSEIPP